jgi:hypothetical protein
MFTSHSHLALQPVSAFSSDTGVIVLSMAGRILHLDESARACFRLFDRISRLLQPHTAVPLPTPLMDLFHDVLAHLEKHIAAEDWSQFEVTRQISSLNGMVLLRGFGMPDRARRQQSRIILVLQPRSEASPS